MVLPIIIGLGVAAAAVVARAGLRAAVRYKLEKETLSTFAQGKNFYLGGFENPMTRSEALRILGMDSPDLISKLRNEEGLKVLKQHHRRIMLLNHPDKGGSKYLAMKINEAKDLLEKKGGWR